MIEAIFTITESDDKVTKLLHEGMKPIAGSTEVTVPSELTWYYQANHPEDKIGTRYKVTWEIVDEDSDPS